MCCEMGVAEQRRAWSDKKFSGTLARRVVLDGRQSISRARSAPGPCRTVILFLDVKNVLMLWERGFQKHSSFLFLEAFHCNRTAWSQVGGVDYE